MAGTCESLTSLQLHAATITLAAVVDAATWPVRISGTPGSHPPFCRVAATLKPSDDSDIKIEVWMPTTGWNGDFEAVGNGGWSGSIGYAAMATALKGGYATASTDTGHEGGSASFALGHPERLIDFAYRSEHEMTVKAKAIVQTFYGKTQTHSYGAAVRPAAGRV
jgi:feruloyl esterase